jgi:hypothetical protein
MDEDDDLEADVEGTLMAVDPRVEVHLRVYSAVYVGLARRSEPAREVAEQALSYADMAAAYYRPWPPIVDAEVVEE